MFKTKSGECFNLPLLLLLGLSKYFLLSVLDTHLATGQSENYSCQPIRGNHSLMVNFRGTRPLIIWNPGELSRCRDVATRFQGASEAGNLRFISRIGNDICGSRTDIVNGCGTNLLSIDRSVDRESRLLRILDGRDRVPASSILENNNIRYYNWQEILPSLEDVERELVNPQSSEDIERRPFDPPPESLGRES